MQALHYCQSQRFSFNVLPSKLQKVEAILKICIVLRPPFAQGSFVDENLTTIKLPNAPTRQAHRYQQIQQQSYEALKSSQTLTSGNSLAD